MQAWVFMLYDSITLGEFALCMLSHYPIVFRIHDEFETKFCKIVPDHHHQQHLEYHVESFQVYG